MSDFYNEFDPFAARWLGELQRSGHLPDGPVDKRSIVDVKAEDLKGYRQAHFFAGIGGWPLALKLAGWPEDEPVWSGSCPCKPFSVAGKARGVGDERHLWPDFHRLIAECHPPVIFGEQVESKDGRYWLAGVRDDLEREGYAVGAADLCAAGVGAPQRRQRLYWVAYSNSRRSEQRQSKERPVPESNASGRMGQSVRAGLEGHPGDVEGGNQSGRDQADQVGSIAAAGGLGGMGDASFQQRPGGSGIHREDDRKDAEHGRQFGGVADSDGGDSKNRNLQRGGEHGQRTKNDGVSFWDDSQIIQCSDRKLRRVPLEPSLFPLAPRVPGRVGLLRGAGGSIVPQAAAEFVRAFMEARDE